MTKYKYDTFAVPGAKLRETLKEHGEKGWRLVAMTFDQGNYQYTLVFEITSVEVTNKPLDL